MAKISNISVPNRSMNNKKPALVVKSAKNNNVRVAVFDQDAENGNCKKDSANKQRRPRVGDPDFEPPDGGWGWSIVFACGFSNLSTFPMFQQFGLLFREHFLELGISSAETTTIINLNSAFNACVGLFNGPVYRKFTYRQVAFFGATLVATSLFTTTFCESFWSYLVVYAMCYGSGIGTTQGANSLALNTYFKKKRRVATGLSWSVTAFGPIVWPYIITFLMSIYGMHGTLLLFSAFAGHAIVCSLLLQPVHWHTKVKEESKPEEPPIYEETKIFTKQYLLNEDDIVKGYEIVDPGTPRMVGPNDGYYSRPLSKRPSKWSLSTTAPISVLQSNQNSFANSKRSSYLNLADAKRKQIPKLSIPTEEETESMLQKMNEKEVLENAARKLAEYKEHEDDLKEEDNTIDEKLSFWDKTCAFFDFNLLKDVGYLNLMLGITIANFAELNFSILTPYVLKAFDYDSYEIATFMSLLGFTDILVRFFIPFLAEKVGWDNKTCFLCGVLMMAAGRIILSINQTIPIGMLVAVIIGFGKGLRTIFMALVIPSYVPLERLPAASGLQLATSGILFLLMGPVVGWIIDLVDNYVITLNLLNIMTYITTIAWIAEAYVNRNKKIDTLD